MFDEKIEQMLDRYELLTVHDHENALKEIIQEIVLLGLWRSKFYEKAVFYGGSALRILHKLERFSENLDFSLIQPENTLDIKKHFGAVKSELELWGFEVSTEEKSKKNESNIDSAFIKANTLIHLLKINSNLKTHKNAVMKIKLEIDQEPAIGFTSDIKYHLRPIPFTIKTMTLPSLFAGKMHALLCRTVRTNIKGRDWYDLIWFVKNNIPCELYYLKNKMVQTGHFDLSEVLDKKKVVELLSEKIKQIDFTLAKRDVEPFLKNSRQKDELNLWSDAFFNDYLIQEIDVLTSQ
ncbi:nucleotidyl transferase AbiEii/AbiGii toxin family protein [Desulfobacter hydrogenophilus]|uniref:Nucleotidyl transferase AbiEii/AbiGii toxin family protein n=1 Tax=Desulfobacter hydrogenophilus TaxID=2291 RepID=A0A328F6P5_9BACT|nr:nucleotidyl transferase AbiEii/AbiGii toxin family protein [Desulfobacter hydrogenophilus]NDY74177.1 nucleotidyl transferase AbiEii/AbiGii toxin family protein [Desulfobacter hydrogenophilus]QBH12601.1 nucleotidyl transferase AbiEii/AbiGii toxin family protein [Desulfobacter hydrogenophilus]RAM00244.1 nucleotidyl transferase AbiEii/AbiGii toxin family protein [Desulfobacter hydrogenophilus]